MGNALVNGRPQAEVSSPDRRHRAHLDLQMFPDGSRRITMNVTNKADSTVATTSATFKRFFASVADFRTLTRQLRWESNSRVVTDDRWRVNGGPWSEDANIDLVVNLAEPEQSG